MRPYLPVRLSLAVNWQSGSAITAAGPIATIGAAGVEVAQDTLTDTQSAIQPLIPYLDTLRWLFIAMALVGIGITIYARWDDWRKGRR